MNKSTKIISSLAALGALCVGATAMAGPWHHPGFGPGPQADCPMAAQGPMGPHGDCPNFAPRGSEADMAYRAERWNALSRMLTITPEQKGAWDAYTAARDAVRTPIVNPESGRYAADEQTRLERRAERAKIRADLLGKAAAARAELLKVLSPEQKYVLEGMEFRHGDRMMDRGPHHMRGFGPRGPMAGPHCGM